ncbi:MAG: class I SAM-dependent rRNA methyltransferase [Anaerolineaceae bacterium]|nr:class I SAM-dependent rRNA methyltransferase [Anaerolineaceae bacterium]
MTATIVIKKGREKPIAQQHPWIFSGAIEKLQGNPAPGDIVTVVSYDNRFLARGYWNPKSQIQVRILTWQDEPIDEGWWRRILARAVAGRAILNTHIERDGAAAAYRLVNAESDYLPGLIVDRYDKWLVVQSLTLGIEVRKPMIAALLAELLKPAGIYERSDVDVRGKEGLKAAVGRLEGESPPALIPIEETSHFYVDVMNGHKTGFYLDQRENRRILFDLINQDISGECRLLNLFSYTGGFGLTGLAAGGVHAVNVDSSLDALELAEKSIQLNSFREQQHGESWEFIQADAFDYLHDALDRREQFDIVVCDPPKFAHNKQQVERAARGYKDLNLNAFKLIKSGGYLITFSCSGAISADLFQKIVFGALADTGRQAQILRHLGPGDDHPAALTFPEGSYLKGLLLRVY